MHIHLSSILLWGLFATGLLTVVMAAAQGFGWTRISFPFLIGTIVTRNRVHAMILGFLMHVVAGVSFAFLYALVFESWGRAGWWTGSLLGLYHGLFVLIVGTSLLPYVHPRMAGKHHGPTPTRQLEPPGFMALNYGKRTPAVTLLGHVAYGLIIGSFYVLS